MCFKQLLNSWQLGFCQIFYEAHCHPRHAIYFSTYPVDSIHPLYKIEVDKFVEKRYVNFCSTIKLLGTGFLGGNRTHTQKWMITFFFQPTSNPVVGFEPTLGTTRLRVLDTSSRYCQFDQD